jgi:hypothetical protein
MDQKIKELLENQCCDRKPIYDIEIFEDWATGKKYIKVIDDWQLISDKEYQKLSKVLNK